MGECEVALSAGSWQLAFGSWQLAFGVWHLAFVFAFFVGVYLALHWLVGVDKWSLTAHLHCLCAKVSRARQSCSTTLATMERSRKSMRERRGRTHGNGPTSQQLHTTLL